MKYTVRIAQTLVGYVELEAESLDKAFDLAEELYIVQGKELPEMDDSEALSFQVWPTEDEMKKSNVKSDLDTMIQTAKDKQEAGSYVNQSEKCSPEHEF